MPKKLVIQAEQPVKFYDKNIGTGELVEPEDSTWYPIYKIVLDFLPLPDKNPSILDVGCGTGMFAKLLYKKGYTNHHYSGFDFSENRVSIARKNVPSFSFVKMNMFDEELQNIFLLFDNIVSLEVLEHITDDLKFLESLPKDKTIIFSVPNYISRSHVRAFYNKEAVIERYGKILSFLDSKTFVGKKKNHMDAYGISKKMYSTIFVFKCIRKG